MSAGDVAFADDEIVRAWQLDPDKLCVTQRRQSES